MSGSNNCGTFTQWKLHSRKKERISTFKTAWMDLEIIMLIEIRLLKVFYLFIFRERRREGEKHQCVVASHITTGDLGHNPGMCPDWELNR